MKAVIFRKHGDLSVLETAQVEDPEPGQGEVRISVKAVALNHLDVWVRKGWPAFALVAISPMRVTTTDVSV